MRSAVDEGVRSAQTLTRLVAVLESAGITYALVGDLALNAHGVERAVKDVEVLLVPNGVTRFLCECNRTDFEQVPHRPRRFTDRTSGVSVKFVLAGHHPGIEYRGPVRYPDPPEGSIEIGGSWFLELRPLIELKLAAQRFQDLADVSALIRRHDLNEDYRLHLQPSVRDDFLQCCHENRCDDEFHAMR